MSLEFWGPDDYDLHAQRHYEAGELDAAIQILREGTAIYPEVAELRVSLGYTELACEEFAWARWSDSGKHCSSWESAAGRFVHLTGSWSSDSPKTQT